MALAQILSGFQAKGVSYKKIGASPIRNLARGDTYVFATSDDALLPKSLGFASSTNKELVIIFTCQALSLVKDEVLENYAYELVASINKDLKICMFLFTGRENKYHFHCRASIREKQDLPINSVWMYLSRIEHEYKENGKRLKTLLLSNQPCPPIPTIGRFPNTQKLSLEHFLTSEKKYKGKIIDSTQSCTIISLDLLVSSKFSSRTFQVPAQLKIYQDYLTCFVFQEAQLDKDELAEKMDHAIALTNHLEVEPIGCLSISKKQELGVAYKADLVFKFINESDLLEYVVPKFLHRCGKKYLHRRKLLSNSKANLLLEVRDLVDVSRWSTTNSMNSNLIGIASEDHAVMMIVYDFWNQKKPGSIMKMANERFYIRDNLWPLFNLTKPDMFHASFLIADMIQNREQVGYSKCDFSLEDRKCYLDATYSEIHTPIYRLQKLFGEILPQLRIDKQNIKVLISELYPSGSEVLRVDSSVGEVKIEQIPVLSREADLWTICKAFAPFNLYATIITEAPKLFGYVYYEEEKCIKAVVAKLPNLIDMTPDPTVDYNRYIRQVLTSLACVLVKLHERHLFHLQLCPAAVHFKGEEVKLTGMKYSSFFLPKLSDVDHFSLQFFAPEVLKVMKNKERWYERPELVNRKQLESVGEAADVYSFGCLMYWLLDLKRTNPPFPDLLASPEGLIETVARKYRPSVSDRFEDEESQLTDLIQQCWSPKRCRPTMETVHSLLGHERIPGF